jgi:hypothetical protein
MKELIDISIKLFSNSIPPNDIEHVYCFAHNNINIPCMVKALNKYNYKNIYLLNNKFYMSGVSSYNEVSNHYIKHNIKTNPLPYNESNNSINTRIESEAVVEWVQTNNIKNLIICAPPYHTLRAFMTLISVCIERNVFIKVYVINGIVDNWNDTTITHGGNTNASFNDVVELEIERIHKYTQKGDICDCDTIWNFML